MHLTIAEAAAALGWTERQVRYAIKQDRIEAVKRGGRWSIAPEALPQSDASRRASADRAEAVCQAAEEALAPVAAAADKAGSRRYSMRDVRAFAAGEPIWRGAVERLSPDDPGVLALRDSLDLLARGCHTYRPSEKAERYSAARERAASAAAGLILDGPRDDPDRLALADRIEQEYLPDVSSLIRLMERSARRSRFHGFGGGR